MISKPPASFTLLDAKEYVLDLTRSIEQAKTRINLMSLILIDDELTHDLIESLKQAAMRGVAVTIAIDAFTYSQLGGFFSPFRRLKRKSRAASEMVRQLRAAGADFTWLGNGYKLNPFAGVTHLKWAIVDDVTYAFGGTNLYKIGIESVDYMLKSEYVPLADQMSRQHLAIIKSNASRQTYPGYMSPSDYGTVYIDSGVRHNSIIYDRICELAEQAEHVLVVTQYCPSGLLAKYLRNKSSIYFNQIQHTPYPDKLLIQYSELRTGIRSSYTNPTYLHAKFMIFTLPDGKKIALTGSHNFSHTGVIFGTREVALETSDVHTINQLEQFYQRYVA